MDVAPSKTRQTLSMTARRVRFRYSVSFVNTLKQVSRASLACRRLSLRGEMRLKITVEVTENSYS